LWIDTNAITLVHSPEYIEQLKPFRSFLRLFISSKNSPELYTAMTRVDSRFADTAFQCIEMLWENKIVAFLQAPIADLFMPESFEWYVKRLLRIHPAAPLLLDIDRLYYMPVKRIYRRLNSVGLWDKRHSGVAIEKQWKKFLEDHYGRRISRLISVDSSPQDENLIETHIFNNQPIERCYLFK
ncbi:hypothetical protein MYX07_04670, partial [Patescibacteria group bacterium AH-259-L07]|nr:hypothetical protein [Patescibacteria group bacterium AH-259-L07]